MNATGSDSSKTRKTLKLGATGPEVFPIGIGLMGMSGMYGPTNDDASVATIQAAIERGATLLDTGDFYGSGHNEMLIGRAIAGRQHKVQLSVKFGALRGPDGSWVGFDLRPASIKNFAAMSLKRLGVDAIDIYRPARLDPNVPIEDVIGTIADLVKAGYVKHIGLSEVGADTVRRAQKVHPIVDLQIEYSLATRGPEEKIFPTLRELGVSATLYGVLSRGLLTGSTPKGPGDYRAWLPRFTGDNAAKNAALVNALRAFAADHRMTPGQLAIAWVRAKQPSFLPVIGVKNTSQLEDALAVLDKELTSAELAALDALLAKHEIVGTRYGADQMKQLDSER